MSRQVNCATVNKGQSELLCHQLAPQRYQRRAEAQAANGALSAVDPEKGADGSLALGLVT